MWARSAGRTSPTSRRTTSTAPRCASWPPQHRRRRHGGRRRAGSSAMQPQIAAAVAEAYPDIIVGIKTAHYWTRLPWDAEHPPWASVERAVEAGELCGMPVMVDFWPRPPERSYPDLILQKLRPGDIHTHVFAQQFPIVDARARSTITLAGAASGASSSTWDTARGASGSATRSRPCATASRPTRSAPTCTWPTSTGRCSACSPRCPSA